MSNTPERLTRIDLIDPALKSAWWDFDTQIIEEEVYDWVELIDWKFEKIWRSGRVDYLLCIYKNWVKLPIAILEAKKQSENSIVWLEQAKKYAKRFNVPMCFSTNGFMVNSYDFVSDTTHDSFPISQFPSPSHLQKLYEENKGFSLDDEITNSLFYPYSTCTNTPRYYQDAAIRAALEKIIAGWNRVLLTLATWAWKTSLAVQLIYKLIKSNNAKKVLFLCDRNTLSKQANTDFSKAFGSDVVLFSQNAKYKNAKIIVATYQSLRLEWEDFEEWYFVEKFGTDYFSHIIIDECHRSGWWKRRLPMQLNDNAVHIWLTATPKQIDIDENNDDFNNDLAILADNFKYFGEPVYEYSIWQGQRDGYLAHCEITTVTLNIDKEVYTRDEIYSLNPIDVKTWQLLSYEDLKETYEARHLDKVLIIPTRTKEFAKNFLENLEQTWWYNQKTIIFCANDLHADLVAAEINNLYVSKVSKAKQIENYAFKFTSKTFLESGEKKETQDTLKADFETKTNNYMIATTVDLLSTGVDIKPLLNVVFFRHINSPILFYQMVGRWTRLHPESWKYMFRIYDYTNSTRLFGKDFIAKWNKKSDNPEPSLVWNTTKVAKIKESDKINMPTWVSDKQKYILVDEKRIPVQEYMDKLVESILSNVKDEHLLRKIWIDKTKRESLVSALYGGIGTIRKLIDLLKLDQDEQYELYDIVKDLVFKSGKTTKLERVQHCKERFEANNPSDDQRQVYETLVSQFLVWWIESLEKKELFDVSGLRELWGNKALSLLWDPVEVIKNIKECILQD